MDETNKIDTAAVRRQYPKDTFVSGRGMCIDPTIEALCDALDEARVDLAIEQGEKSEWQESCNHWAERTERAEAKIARVEAQRQVWREHAGMIPYSLATRDLTRALRDES